MPRSLNTIDFYNTAFWDVSAANTSVSHTRIETGFLTYCHSIEDKRRLPKPKRLLRLYEKYLSVCIGSGAMVALNCAAQFKDWPPSHVAVQGSYLHFADPSL